MPQASSVVQAVLVALAVTSLFTAALAVGPRWGIPSPRPEPSQRTALVTDGAVLVAYGGMNPNNDVLNQVQVHDPETGEWRTAVATGTLPSPLLTDFCANIVTSKAGKKYLILHGGYVTYPYLLGDVYALDLSTFVWSKPPINASQPQLGTRALHACCSYKNNFFAHGGWAGITAPAPFNTKISRDAWMLDIDTWVWKQFNSTDEFHGRENGRCAEYEDTVVISGGKVDSPHVAYPFQFLNVTQNAWTYIDRMVTPETRTQHGFVIVKDTAVMVGGRRDSSSLVSRVLEAVSLTNFTAYNVTQPAVDVRARAHAVVVEDKLYYFAGETYSNQLTADILRVQLPSAISGLPQTEPDWTARTKQLSSVSGSTIGSMGHLSFVRGDDMIVVGGRADLGFDPIDETRVLDLVTLTWRVEPTTGTHIPHSDGGGVYDPVHDRFIQFAGVPPTSQAKSEDNTVYLLDLAQSPWKWRTPNTTGVVPEARRAPSCVLVHFPLVPSTDASSNRSIMYCYGGSPQPYTNTESKVLTALDVSSSNDFMWIPTTITADASTTFHYLSGPAVAYYDQRLYIYGGSAVVNFVTTQLNDILSIDLTGVNPTAVPGESQSFILRRHTPSASSSVPSGRSLMDYAMIGGVMAVFGGVTGQAGKNDLFFLDLDSTTFYVEEEVSVDSESKPPPLQSGSMVLHRGRLVVFGGRDDQARKVNTTWILRPPLHSVDVSVDGDNLQCVVFRKPCRTPEVAVQMFSNELLAGARIQPSSRIRSTFYIRHSETPLQIHQPLRLFDSVTLSGDIENWQINARRGVLLPRASMECNSTETETPFGVLHQRCIQVNVQQQNVGLDNPVLVRDLIIQAHSSSTTFFSGIEVQRASLTLERCTVSNHVHEDTGGAFFASQATILLESSEFINNTAKRGGAGFVFIAQVTINNSTFVNNTASDADGGAVTSVFSNMTVTHSYFVNNLAMVIGGACFVSFGDVSMSHVTFERNRALEQSIEGVVEMDLSEVVGTGGGICAVEASSFALNQVRFLFNAAPFGGALALDKCKNPSVTGSTFTSNSANYYGGAVFLSRAKSDSKATFHNSSFTSNAAIKADGGALASASSTAIVSNSSFANNSASVAGGGAMYWTVVEPVSQGNTFSHNNAIYGPQIASSPSRLAIVSSFNAGDQQNSGSRFTTPVSVGIVDAHGQLITSDSSTFVNILARNQSSTISITGIPTVRSKNGIATFESTGLQAAVGHTYNLTFSASTEDGRVVRLEPHDLQVTLRSCDRTIEIITNDGTVCSPIQCSVGQYIQVSGGLGTCQNCPPSGANCPGNGVILSEQDYWIFYREDGSAEAVTCAGGRCLNGLECGLGNATNTEAVSCCGANRKPPAVNPLCGACVDGFQEVAGECVQCDTVNYPVVILLLLMSWFYVLMFHRLSQTSFGRSKVFFYNVQMVIIFFAAADPRWLDWLRIFNFQLFTASCVAPMSDTLRFMFNVIAPLTCLCELILTFFIHMFYWWVKHDQRCPPNRGVPVKFKKSPYIRSCFGLITLCYNSVSLTVFSYFKCIEVGPGTSVMAEYPTISCESSEYKALFPVILSLLLGFIVVFPLLVTLGLRYVSLHSEYYRVKENKLRERFGILFESYRRSRWYWEFVVILRRVGSIGLTVALFDDERLYTVLSITNLFILVTHIAASPFRKPDENQMETWSLALLTVLTIVLGSFRLPYSTLEEIVLICLVYFPVVVFGALVMYSWLKIIPERFVRAQQETAVDGNGVVHRARTFSSIVSVQGATHRGSMSTSVRARVPPREQALIEEEAETGALPSTNDPVSSSRYNIELAAMSSSSVDLATKQVLDFSDLAAYKKDGDENTPA